MKYDNETINYINKNINLLEYVSQYISLEKRNGEWWSKCPLPNHKDDDNPSFSINEEKNLFSCFGCHNGGTPIVFVQLYHNLSFPEAVKHLIDYANLKIVPREYSEILNFLHKSNLKQKKEKQKISRKYLPNNIMEKYDKEPIIEWINEGIKPEIMDEYEVRYDRQGNRIVYPIKDDKGIIAVKGRTLYKNYKDLGIVKYIYYQPIGSNDFLFGLYKNRQHIKEKNEVLVFESAKSVMLAEGYGYKNAVSLETSNINSYQIDLLLQLKCDITMCLDKGIKIIDKKIQSNKYKNNYVNIGLLSKFTNVYVVEDKNNLLEEKASPSDQGKDVWEKLYEEKYKI